MSFKCLFTIVSLVVLATFSGLVERNELQAANTPLQSGEIIITEFFDGMYRVNPTSGNLTPIQLGSFAPGDLLAVDNQHRILSIDSAGSLKRFDPVTMSVNTLSTQTFINSVDMAIEPSGMVLVATNNDIYRVNPSTMQTDTLVEGANVNDGLFSPAGIAVTMSGQIYASEFFEPVWRINPQSGAATSTQLAKDYFFQNRLSARTNGELISYDFETHELKKINPDTKAVTTFSSDLPTFVNSLAIESDNDMLLTSQDGIFRYNATTGVKSTLVPEGDLFLPQGIAVVPGVLSTLGGDFNGDNKVDGMDFVLWQQGGSPTPLSTDDLLDWQTSYGAGGLQASANVVPEPLSLVMLASVLTGFVGRRARSHS